MSQEALHDLHRCGVFVVDLVQHAVVEGEDLGSGVGEQNRRMCRDDELCVLEHLQGVVQQDEERQQALWRECGFGFVDEEEAVAAKFVTEEGEEALSVRLVVKLSVAVAADAELIDVGGGVEEAFGAEVVTGSGADVEGEAQDVGERIDRVIALGGVVGEVAIAALGAEAVVGGDGFEQGGLATAIFPGAEEHAGTKHQFAEGADRGNAKGVGVPVVDAFAEQDDLLEHVSC